MSNLEAYKRAFERERKARKEAEKVLEEKSSQLYALNQELMSTNSSLEFLIQERTEELEQIARFPEEDPFPVFRIDINGELVYSNEAGKQLLNKFEKEDILNQFKKWVDEGLEVGEKKIETLFLASTTFRVDFIHITKFNYINFYLTDINEQLHVERLLKQSEAKYKSVIENMRLGLLEVDNDNKITRAYEQFCVLTGYSEEELIGKIAVDVFTRGEFTEQVLAQQNKRLNGEESVYEAQIYKKSGEQLWVLISGAPLFNENGEVIGSMGIHLDITESKNNEEELISSRFQAEASAKSKEVFLANMSHEIRTPMNAILGMIELLFRSNCTDNQLKYLNVISKSATNLLTIINDILDLSKVDSGGLSLQLGGFRINEVIEHVLQLSSLKAEEKDLLLNVRTTENLSSVFVGDGLRLTQVLINLIGNAIKFTDRGAINLEVQLLNDLEDRQEVLFKILDTGKGISKENIQRVFEPFRQEDESISKKYGGTGLGLSITQSLIRLMGGEICVNSELGKGSEFYFTLTLTKGDESSLPQIEHLEIDYAELKGLKVLLAEDNLFNQAVVEGLFEEHNIELTIVQNGAEAVDQVKKEEYDIILMDVQMPVLNGLHATEQIRNNKEINQPPILALTANAFKNECEKYLKYGMNDYLSKPYDPDHLYQKMLSLVNQKKMALTNNISTSSIEKNTENRFCSLEKLYQMSSNNETFVLKMVDSFLEHTPPILSEVATAQKEHNWERVSELCHRLKASYNTLSIDVLKSDLYSLERECDTLSVEQREEMVDRIISISNKVFEELKQEK